jgi:precorrin-6B methylase 2
MAEHKVALDKIVDIAANYLNTEDRAVATSSKLEEAYQAIDDLKARSS